jgi:hypothetical protein
MNEEVIISGLEDTASTSARVKALLEAGIPSAIIASVVGKSEKSILRWADGVNEPAPNTKAREKLDAFRYVMGTLILEKHIHPAQATEWLLSKQAGSVKPVDLIGEYPELVIKAAQKKARE